MIAAQFTMKYSKYSFIAFKKFPITFCLVTKCVLIPIPIFLFFQIAFRCIFYLFQDSMTVDTNNPDSLETKTSPQSEEDIFLISCREGQERY